MKPAIDELDLTYAGGTLVSIDDGVELYCEVNGSGPPLTIINNYFVVAPAWRNFTSRIAQDRRVLTYDLRNQGASTTSGSAPVQIKGHVDDLARLLDALDIERTALLGTSVSTLIAREFVYAHPDRVSALVMVGPIFNPLGSGRRKSLTKSWLRSLDAGGPAQLFGHMYPLVFSEQTVESGGASTYVAMRERFLALNSHEQAEINLRASLTVDDDAELLPSIKSPTLLLAGEADFFTSESMLAGICALIPDARYELIPHAGHVPYFEATAGFEERVNRFLNEVAAREALE